MTWLEQFRPQNLGECIGIRSEFNAIKQFFVSWKEGRPIGDLLILSGLAGTGKTTLVHAIGNDLNMEVIEVNASMTRNKDALESAIAPAYLSTFSGRMRILLLDEADGIRAWQVIEGLVKSPPCAIVLTANDQSKIPYSLRKQSLQYNLQPPSERHRLRLIDRICEEEGLGHPQSVRVLIARECTSWRSVVATLQTTPEDIEVEDLEERLHDVSQADAITSVLKGKPVPKSPRNITLLNYANYNGVDVSDGLLLYQWSKQVAGMSKISQAWAEAIRVKGLVDTPPFRKKKDKQPKATTSAPQTRTKQTTVQDEPKTPPPQANGFGGFFT